MVDPRQELVELIDLVEEVAACVEALDDPAPSPAGTTPQACEERAVRTAGARLAARRAREMREGLDRLRAHARHVAEQARHSGAAARAPGAAPTAWSGTAWTAVERAGRRLAGLPVDEGDVPCARILEIVREALPAVGHVDLVALDEQGRPAAAGDRALLEAGEAERAAGDGSLLVLPLGADGDEGPEDQARPMALVLGVTDEDGFDPVAARLVAVQVAVLMSGSRRVAGLRRALESRDLIGQAKGIVMAREGVDAQAAFRVLAEASQHANLKLTAVARWLVEEAAGRDGR